MIDPDRLYQTINELGLDYKNSRNSYIFKCPLCDKSDKLYIRKKDGAFICFSCADLNGFKGKADYALSILSGCTLQEIRSKLNGEITALNFNETFSFDFPIIEEAPEEEIILEEKVYPYGFYPISHKLSCEGQRYLESRGIPQTIAAKYEVYYDIATKRVVFPVKANGSLYGWQARSTRETTYFHQNQIKRIPKILTENGTPRDKLVMFYDRLLNSDKAVLTEGPIDAIKCDLIGGNVACMGKMITHWQIKLLKHLNIRKLYLGLDSDALDETIKLVNDYGDDFDMYLLEIPSPYKDLGEMSFQAVLEQYNVSKLVNKPKLIFDLAFNF